MIKKNNLKYVDNRRKWSKKLLVYINITKAVAHAYNPCYLVSICKVKIQYKWNQNVYAVI